MNNIMKLAQEYAVRYRVNRAVDEARAALEAAVEQQAAEIERLNDRWAEWKDSLNSVMEQRNALQAKLDELQRQEPVAHFGSAYVNENGVHITTVLGPVAIPQDAKLYAAPKACEPLTAQAVPWKCINGEACKHGWWCSESYCQEHCVFMSPLTKGQQP